MKSGTPFQPGKALAGIITLVPLFSFFPLVALSSENTSVPPGSAETIVHVDNDSDSVIDQLNLQFRIGDTTHELNKEESGINSLSDAAGRSESGKQLLALKEKYQEQLKRDPQNEIIWVSLGSVLETLGEEELALSAFRKALSINSENQAAGQGDRRIKRSRGVLTRVYYSYQRQKEYSPVARHDIATWEEQVTSIQASKSWGRGKTFGIGWLDSTITQENELYGDIDFSLKRQAPFMYFSWPVFDTFALSMRVRDEKFTSDDDTGYYQLVDSEHILTGYLALAYRSTDFWVDVNYSREREPDPVYDSASGRSALNIEVKQLTGLSTGYTFAPTWELASSLYYEQYGSARSAQFNPNIQLNHWLTWLPGFRVSLGYGYYSEEYENILNLTTSYQWQPFQDVQCRAEYQLEYSGNEDSVLNQGDFVLSWSIVDRLSLDVRADYSQESGGDEDRYFSARASLNLLFF